MKTIRMMIDMDDGVMKVRAQDEEVSFNLFGAMKHSKDKNDRFRIDAMEESVMKIQEHFHKSTPLERVLTNDGKVFSGMEENKSKDCLQEIEVVEEIPPNDEIVETLKERPKVKKLLFGRHGVSVGRCLKLGGIFDGDPLSNHF